MPTGVCSGRTAADNDGLVCCFATGRQKDLVDRRSPSGASVAVAVAAQSRSPAVARPRSRSPSGVQRSGGRSLTADRSSVVAHWTSDLPTVVARPAAELSTTAEQSIVRFGSVVAQARSDFLSITAQSNSGLSSIGAQSVFDLSTIVGRSTFDLSTVATRSSSELTSFGRIGSLHTDLAERSDWWRSNLTLLHPITGTDHMSDRHWPTDEQTVSSSSIADVDLMGSFDRDALPRKIRKFGRKERVCRVCGDQAISVNFNVITCESCKAFFRRNALKPKAFKCPFRGDCEINKRSRKFCKKCRLRKCFDVGMMKEWILSDDARKKKQELINTNREKRRSTIMEAAAHSITADGCFQRMERNDFYKAVSFGDLQQLNGVDADTRRSISDLLLQTCSAVPQQTESLDEMITLKRSMLLELIFNCRCQQCGKSPLNSGNETGRRYSMESVAASRPNNSATNVQILPEDESDSISSAPTSERNSDNQVDRANAMTSQLTSTSGQSMRSEQNLSYLAPSFGQQYQSIDFLQKAPNFLANTFPFDPFDIRSPTMIPPLTFASSLDCVYRQPSIKPSSQLMSSCPLPLKSTSVDNFGVSKSIDDPAVAESSSIEDVEDSIDRSQHPKSISQRWPKSISLPLPLLLRLNELLALPGLLSANTTQSEQMTLRCYPQTSTKLNEDFTNDLVASIIDRNIRQISDMCQQIVTFSLLNPLDQVQLLQDCCKPILILRELVNAEHCSYQEPLRSFSKMFLPSWKTDKTIMHIIVSLILFDPNQPKLVDAKTVAIEQSIYFDLLQHYVKYAYDDGEIQLLFVKLTGLLVTLRQRKDDFIFAIMRSWISEKPV